MSDAHSEHQVHEGPIKTPKQLISDRPVHEQESLAPVDFDAPVYTSQQTRRVSLGGVAAGTIVDYSYTTETVEPVLRGDFATSWSIHTGTPTLRSRYVLDLPAGYQPRIQEHNLTFRRREVERNGRRVYTWATNDVPSVDQGSLREITEYVCQDNGKYNNCRDKI